MPWEVVFWGWKLKRIDMKSSKIDVGCAKKPPKALDALYVEEL